MHSSHIMPCGLDIEYPDGILCRGVDPCLHAKKKKKKEEMYEVWH